VKPSYDDFAVSATDIGAGNFSRVMKARHRPTGQPFAMKVIEKAKVRRLSVRHKNMSNEIMMEKLALLKLKGHRNIVTLHHTWSDESALYYLYELVDGGELWNALLDDKLLIGMDYCQIRWYFLQILDALEFMHRKGVVHRCCCANMSRLRCALADLPCAQFVALFLCRDLKPENVMVTSDGVVKLVDFGTAKDLVDVSRNGPEFVGTPDYMAPEVVNGGAATPASDLWAFGCMLYQSAVGRTPFKVRSSTC
jgi:serine/threonine protein kinase